MLTRADEPADGGIAGGEEETGTRRLGEQWLDIRLAPHIVYYDQCGLASNGCAVLVLAGQGVVIIAQVIAQRLGHLAHLLDEVALSFLAGGDPGDAVGEGPLDHFIVDESLG